MLHLRPATDQDKAFVKRLNEEAYRAVVVEQFGAWDDPDQGSMFESEWKTHAWQIVEQRGRQIGAMVILRHPDHIWLHEILVSPEHQGEGIGTELLLGLIDRARASNLPLRLRVLKANRARLLYQRIGFRTTGMFEDTHYDMELTA